MFTAQTLFSGDELDVKIDSLDLSGAKKKQLKNIFKEPICYVANPIYENPEEMAKILAQTITVCPGGQVDMEETTILFHQSNYSRLQLSRLRRQLSNQIRWQQQDLLDILNWYDRHLDARERIVAGNMGLVLGMSKQVNYPWVEFTDLISEGSMALLRATDKFDPQRGVKFSTYACRVILRALARLAQKSYRHRALLFAQGDAAYEVDDFLDTRREMARNNAVDEVSAVFNENLAQLSTVERSVVRMRFSLGESGDGPQTLAAIGDKLGLTKERIRQIQNKALGKLRVAVEERIANV